MRKKTGHSIFPILLLSAVGAQAQWTYPNCDNATDANFTVTTVVSRALNDPGINEPLKMDFSMAPDGTVDIVYVMKKGDIKYYDGKAKTVKLVGNVQPVTTLEDGLVGLALHPDFRTNGYAFFYYAHSTGFRLSRFTIDPAAKTLVAGSEKILLTIPSGRGRWHTAGAMKFDPDGNLWIAVGDNETTSKGPANTADLRGSILRIHPEADGTYTIPKGNMWEHASAYFRAKGMTAVADQYQDPAKMKREVYVKGVRNPYTLTVDPVRRWPVYGDCGPDQESSNTTDRTKWTEEQNVVTEPGFMGWPFWTAEQNVQEVFPPGYDEAGEMAAWKDWTSMNPASPVNDPPGAGIKELPPAKPGTYSYAHSCAMTGPIFRYDGTKANPGQIPPHFNGVWFTTDFNRGRVMAVRLGQDGKMTGNAVEVFKGLSTNFLKPLDFQQGPDGSLYYLNYTCGPWNAVDACTGIYRIDYKGTCKDPNLKPEITTALPRSLERHSTQGIRFDRDLGTVSVASAGPHRLEILAVDGRLVFTATAPGPRDYAAAEVFAGLRRGLYLARLSSAGGVSETALPFLGLRGD